MALKAVAKVELLSLETAPLLVRERFAGGYPGPITAALANVPELAGPALDLIAAVYGPTRLDARQKEIVILRVSVANGCSYCITTHSRVAAEMGFEVEEVDALRLRTEPPSGFGPVERALVAFSDSISSRPAEAVADLRPHFDDSEIVELVLLASTTILLNRLSTALELPA